MEGRLEAMNAMRGLDSIEKLQTVVCVVDEIRYQASGGIRLHEELCAEVEGCVI